MRVLVATDGEEPSALAERFVADVADRTSVETLTACVNTFEMSLQRSEAEGLDHYAPEEGARHAARVVQAAVERLSAAGFVAGGRTADGDAAFGLLDIIAQERCDLAVLGAAKGRMGGHPLIGRVCRHLLLEAPCSVALVHTWAASEQPRNVLVATDGSPSAEHAVRAFATFADPASCDVLVTSVARPLIGGSLVDAEARTDPTLEDEATEAAGRAAAVLRDRGFACRVGTVHGLPAAALLDLAEREGSALVVVGSRGLGRLRRMAIGSVSDAVARHAPAAFVGRSRTGGGQQA
jgi:nucleotide-binding universal stress UspA family protein